jgi:hypothetical protein
MVLAELTNRLQALCHEGWSQNNIAIKINGITIDFENLDLILKSDSSMNGEIALKIGENN